MSALPRDQAADLRRLMQPPAPRRMSSAPDDRPADSPPRAARVLAVASGKGGVGKTNLAVNLALMLASRGRRVLLVDTDLGTANADLLLNLDARSNLSHVLDGRKSLDEVVVPVPTRGVPLRVVAGASGLAEVSNLSDEERGRLIELLSVAERAADLLILDCGAGISANVTDFAAAADDLLVVATPEPTAITDAYALIKTVTRTQPGAAVSLVVNQARSRQEGRQVGERIAEVAARFLGAVVQPIGVIPADEHVPAAVRQRSAFVQRYPGCPAAAAISGLASHFDVAPGANRGRGGFFRKVVELFY